MPQIPDDELISAYLDGELSGEELVRAEHLLATQPESRQLFEELTTLRARLRALPRAQLGDDLTASVLRQAEREMIQPSAGARPSVPQSQRDAVTLKERGWQRWKRPVAWSAMAAAAALLIMLFSPADRQVAQAPAPMAGGELQAAHEPGVTADVRQDIAGAAIDIAHRAKNPEGISRQAELQDFLANRAEMPASEDEVLIVRCDIDAGQELALRQLLSEQKIDWDDAVSAQEKLAGEIGKSKAADRANTLPEYAHKGIVTDQPGDEEAVFVTAEPEQLRAALSVLARNRAFRHVTVEQATAVEDELAALESAPMAASSGERSLAASRDNEAADSLLPSAAAARDAAGPAVAKRTMRRSEKEQPPNAGVSAASGQQPARSRAQRVPRSQIAKQLQLIEPAAKPAFVAPVAAAPADASRAMPAAQQQDQSPPKPAAEPAPAAAAEPPPPPAESVEPAPGQAVATPSAPADEPRQERQMVRPQSRALILLRVVPPAAQENPR